MTICFTPGMNSAPTDREILALWESGEIAICRWDSDKYNRRGPKPYWSVPGQRGVAEQRANPPIAWCELRAAPAESVPVNRKAMDVLRERVDTLNVLEARCANDPESVSVYGRYSACFDVAVAARQLLGGGAVSPSLTAPSNTTTSVTGVNSDRLVTAFFEGLRGCDD